MPLAGVVAGAVYGALGAGRICRGGCPSAGLFSQGNALTAGVTIGVMVGLVLAVTLLTVLAWSDARTVALSARFPGAVTARLTPHLSRPRSALGAFLPPYSDHAWGIAVFDEEGASFWKNDRSAEPIERIGWAEVADVRVESSQHTTPRGFIELVWLRLVTLDEKSAPRDFAFRSVDQQQYGTTAMDAVELTRLARAVNGFRAVHARREAPSAG